MLGLKVDDTVGVLNDRPWLRAGFQAAGVGTVHAAVLADQPFEVAAVGVLVLGEAHQRPGFGAEVVGVVVGAGVAADLVAQLVPFRAGHLAGLAADALGGVDQLGHLAGLTDLRHRRGGGGAGDDVLSSHVTPSPR
ncbi:hypothetical protein D3C75_1077490 [compost metagenome]